MASHSLLQLHGLVNRLPEPLRKMLALLTSIFTLRNILLVFFLLNIKTLPMVWELRLIYRAWQSWIDKRGVAKKLEKAASTSSSTSSNSALPISTHPLFAPLTISSRSPLLEIDHNLHKSNSTYFTDLDESRTALMVHLLSSTKFSPAELDGEGIKGNFAVILASVHSTFLKEIEPYERYSVRSRIMGWDEKWIIIQSVFVRPKNANDRKREKKAAERKAKLAGDAAPDKGVDRGEVLLATCLSKYVVKKGRFTVPPERCWRSAGWLPEKPDGETKPAIIESSSTATPDPELVNGEVKITGEDLQRRAQGMAAKATQRLEQAKSETTKQELSKADEACQEAASKWAWADIEAERKRGMKLVENWLRLDGELKNLWEEDHQRGIVH